MLQAELYNMIFKRKSFHIFRNVGDGKITSAEIQDIYKAYKGFSSLYPHIKTEIEIVSGNETTCKRGQDLCVLLYSEKKEGYLQNIGYIGQQLDLYLVSKNIGTLWFGIGKTDEKEKDGLDFVIMIAVRKIEYEDKFRKDMFKSKRKPTQEIWHGEAIEGITDIIRFAPSACNSQPWIVERTDNQLKVYRYKKEGKRGIMPADKVSFYNRIDIGIFLCFLDLCLEHKGIYYERILHKDTDGDDESTLNAVYKLDI